MTMSSEVESLREEISKLKVELELARGDNGLFRKLFISYSAPTFLWETQNGTFVLRYYNQAVDDWTNGQAAKFVGLTAEQIYPDRPDLLALFQKSFQENETIRFETPYRSRGTNQNIELVFTFIPIESSYLLLEAVDLTNIRQMQRTIDEQEALSRSVFRTMHEGMVIQDLDDQILMANPAAARILNLSLDQLMGKDSFDPRWKSMREDGSPFQPEDHPSMIVSRTGKPVRNTIMSVQIGDGARTFISINSQPIRDENGQMTKTVTTFRDISEQKKQEIQLQAVNGLILALNPAKSKKDVVFTALKHIQNTFHAEDVALETYDLSTKTFITELSLGKNAQFLKKHQNRSFILDSSETDPIYSLNVTTDDETETGNNRYTLTAAPLRDNNKITGVIWLTTLQSLAPFQIELLVTLADISSTTIKRTILEEETSMRLQQLTALRKVDQAIAGSLDLHLTLTLIIQHAIAQLDVNAVAVHLLNENMTMFKYEVGRGFRTRQIKRKLFRAGERLAGKAAEERRTITISNLTQQDTDSVLQNIAKAEDFSFYAVAPLIAKGKVRGVIELYKRAELTPSRDWLRFLEALIQRTAIAIDGAQLFENLQRSNQELILAYDDTILGWAKVLDLRDKETEGHSVRVMEMSLYLSKQVGISQNQLVHIRRGALLHDIGKMAIPDSVLLKPGKLTPDERKIIEMHPVYAYDMLSKIAFLRPALDIPYAHHEKWDGTGYPLGLKGEDIPLSARIFAVIDVWDALLSDRPYRKAWTPDKVLAYIRENSGSHFDPDIIHAFNQMIVARGLDFFANR